MAQFTATFTLGYTEEFLVESGVGSITVDSRTMNLQATEVTDTGVVTLTQAVAFPFTLLGGVDGTTVTVAANSLVVGKYV